MTCRLVVALALVAAVLMPRAADACKCLAAVPACEQVWKVDAVFDGVVTAIDVIPLDIAPRDMSVPDLQQARATFQVRTTWRGPTDSVIAVLTGMGGGDCGFPFKLNRRYLVYAARRTADARSVTGICTRTVEYDGTGEDAAFLDSLSRAAPGGGRIAGEVRFWPRSMAGSRPVETQVTLMGRAYTRMMRSKDGRFAFGDVPPGPYTVRIVVPGGMRISEPSRRVEIPDPHACAEVEFVLVPDGWARDSP
jgi:hypothetical protein